MQDPNDSPEQAPKDRKFVEALARGLEVLRAFTHGHAVRGNQDIARITGLPKPTVSRLTYTLTQLGYLKSTRTWRSTSWIQRYWPWATPTPPACGCASWASRSWTSSRAAPTPPSA